MYLLGNLIWLIFGGFLAALGLILGGLSLCFTIVGIPFGLQAIRLGVATLAPFGKSVVEPSRGASPVRTAFDILWLVLFGWELVLHHLLWAALLTMTIVGIPFARQHLKLIPVSAFPFTRELR